MGLFDFLKSKKAGQTASANGSNINPAISDEDLRPLIRAAVLVFQNNTDLDQDGIIDLIMTHCDDEKLAMALYRFIPIAYCRLFIPEPAYSDEYILYKSENDKASYYFSEDTIYKLVLAVCTERLKHAQSSDNIYSILYHSAEFKAINSALINGSDLKDLVCSPAYFL